MKQFLFLPLLLGSLLAIGQTPVNDVNMATKANTIKNETVPSQNDANRIGTLFKDLVYSKQNINQDQFVVTSGTDTYTVSVLPAITSYVTGFKAWVRFGTENTGPATINFNSLGAKAIKKNVSEALEAGDITANQILPIVYDGTNFQMGAGVGVEIDGAALTKVDDTNVTLTLGGSPTVALLSPASLTLGWTGALALSRGGLGTALVDPGAHRLLGWDDTDNAVSFITPSNGLSYNQATHSLRLGGTFVANTTIAGGNFNLTMSNLNQLTIGASYISLEALTEISEGAYIHGGTGSQFIVDVDEQVQVVSQTGGMFLDSFTGMFLTDPDIFKATAGNYVLDLYSSNGNAIFSDNNFSPKGLQYNVSDDSYVTQASSLANKFYVDNYLGGKDLTPPGSGQDGLSLKYNFGTLSWDYFDAVGIDDVIESGTSLTLTNSHNGKIIYFTNAAAVTVSLPTGLVDDFNVILLQDNTGTITVTTSGATLNGSNTTASQYETLSIIQYKAANTYIGK